MIANHFKVSLESKPTIENLVYTVSLRFGCYAPDLIEPITVNSLPPRVTIDPRRSKPRHLQFTPIFKHGNTFQLESKTQAAQPIHAGLN